MSLGAITSNEAIKKWRTATARRGGRTLTAAERAETMRNLYNGENGRERLAASLTAPIAVRINYEGVSRQVLVEDLVPDGMVKPYPLLNSLPEAFSVNINGSEIKSSLIKNKQIIPSYDYISVEWVIDRADLSLLAVNPIQYADQVTVQQMAKEEDKRLYAALELALQRWQENNKINGALNTANTITTTTSSFAYNDFMTARGQILSQQNEPAAIIMNARDITDILKWNVTNTSVQYIRDVENITSTHYRFDGLDVYGVLTCPQGTAYMVPKPDHLGVFSTRYGITCTPDITRNSQMQIANIFSELVAILVMNQLGIVKITKSTSGTSAA